MMGLDIYALVLLAAFMHACWNALVKSGDDRLLTIVVVMFTGSVLCAFLAPFVALPRPEAWWYMLGSTAAHLAYYALLVQAYHAGDLSHVYPIARGTAPLIVASLSSLALAEPMDAAGMTGVALVSLGVISLSWRGGAMRAGDGRAVALALAVSLSIVAYTLIDGLGVRAAGDAMSYIVWLNILEGLPLALAALVLRRKAILPFLRGQWRRGIGGGLIATGTYAIVMWAYGQTAIAPVAALREISVVFAAAIGTLFLGEAFGRRRLLSAGVVAAGAALLGLAGR